MTDTAPATVAGVEPSYADWLKAAALYAVAVNPAAADWGDSGLTGEIVSPLALEADAIVEATRQLAFLGVPIALDEHVLVGQWASLVGQLLPLAGDRLGYEATPVVLVIGAVEQTDGTTVLTVLSRL